MLFMNKKVFIVFIVLLFSFSANIIFSQNAEEKRIQELEKENEEFQKEFQMEKNSYEK